MCDARCRTVSECPSDRHRAGSSAPSSAQGGAELHNRDISPPGSPLLPSHSLDKTRSAQHQFIFPVLARSGGIVAAYGSGGSLRTLAEHWKSRQISADCAAASTSGPGQLGAVEDDLVGKARVTAPGTLGTRPWSGLRLNEQDSDDLPVECRDDRVGASAHFGISPAQIVESVEVDGVEAIRQGEVGLLLTTCVDEAGTNRCIGQNDHGCMPIVDR